MKHADESLAAAKNGELLERISHNRQQQALLKGYNSFAEEQTEGAMARTPGTVETFIDSLTEKMIPHGRDEIRALTNLKRKQTGQYLASLEPWDVLYYKNMLDE